ncbi:MAG: hypothetical protein EB015_20660 [Methylocystaceae bacterium]|nr:hypothetical protein [Methylocystaceae bacterium]
MITVILSLIGGLFSLAGKIFEFMYAQKLIDAGKTSQQLDDLKGQIDAAQKAIALREKARRDAELNPGGVLQPDEFTRPED